MQLNQSELHITQRAREWRIGGDDHFVADTVDHATVVVPDVELATLHPLLPQSLRARIAHTTSLDPMRGFLSNVTFKTTLRYLLTGGVQFRDTKNSLLTFAYMEHLIETNPGAIDVTGAYIELKHSPDNIPFIMGSMMHDARVAAGELDKKYPGWRGRWLVGQELGLGHQDLMTHIFTVSVPPVNVTEMSNLTFD